MRKFLASLIYVSRWILYPINVGLLFLLVLYVSKFLYEDFHLISTGFHTYDMEALTVLMLGFVDTAMVANLMIMIVQGGHQIFIDKFELPDKAHTPQYLDHIDTGLLKVKVAQSIATITLVQILKDSMNLAKVGWELIQQRILIHGAVLVSVLVLALVWRILHPKEEKV